MDYYIRPEQRTYMRLVTSLRQDIDKGVLVPGSAMPSITRLCKIYECSRRPAGRAMQILESEGVIYRVPGLGYFVAAPL